MADGPPEDMVYSITTGFYPQLFSGKPFWKREKGTGRKGMQWTSTAGFSKASVKKIAGKRIDKAGWGSFISDVKGTKKRKPLSWKEAIKNLILRRDRKGGPKDGLTYAKGIETRGMELGYLDDAGAFSQERMEKDLNYYKFMGNNEHYKLWGSKVWWQAGHRYKAHDMESALEDWNRDSKDKGVASYLETKYSDEERELWVAAEEIAKEVFGNALDEDNLREDIESVGTEAHVPEEERKEGERYSKAKLQKVDTIDKEWHAVSKARGLDIKLRMDKDTTIYMDSTEMPLHQKGSHGITAEVTADIRKAIKKAKTEDGETWKETLKEAVIKMFAKSIKTYNIDIKRILEIQFKDKPSDKQGMERIKEIMKEIKAERKKAGEGHAGSPKASVASIVDKINDWTHHNYKGVALDAVDEAGRDTSMKYVVHMLVNLASDITNQARQGHLIGKIKGRNTYASVSMKLEERKTIPQFSESHMAENVLILQGENHLIAYQEEMGLIQDGKSRETHARQIQAFQQGKIIGTQASSGSSARASANMGIVRGCRPTTSVVLHPKALKGMINKIPEIISDNVDNDQIMEGFNTSVNKRNTHKILQHQKAKFWAMPYLGIMEYPSEAKEVYPSIKESS